MTDLIEIKVPDLGGATEVEVVEVLIKPGDSIAPEQTLAVMESDKATMDLPSTQAGTIVEVKVKVGDKISQGHIIALFAPAESLKPEAEIPASAPKAEAPATSVAAAPSPEVAVEPAKPAPPPPLASHQPVSIDISGGAKPHATPAVRLFARELGIDLYKISKGTGRKGRILKEDIKSYVKQTLNTAPQGGVGAGIPSIPAVDFTQFGEIETLPLSKIKRLTGQNLTRVWLNLPMVTHHDEADITDLEDFRKSINNENKENKLTGLIFITKALATVMKQFPQFNASLSPDAGSLIFKKYCHIGIAVDTPNGLVVPVLRDVDKKSIFELSSELAELSEKARAGKLKPAEMQGGCMTISSLGGIGGTAFTPIVNAPEVAILGITRAKMQPVWDGKQFVPRLILPLDLSYDHRVIDGAEAARFMVTLSKLLSDIRRFML
ncbi:dihydrolipoyllysine-residue acetyltransferase [Methylicorpusculum sp.]|uniref:dihydrolipoyllysine-residue acetyltransferase n=1 Tax=Methylicorpusculum sp. TaxID=2713644 RepID=UPI00272F3139|nr:dihydrolipoyllysine-residue acetyltransferase [Methylicorpusculum sp.]MDP2180103.1 dihydrolipoyllysine-residue acetyltransferase [Methylicorpusculum sp.]MDP3530656.1 dihydrolipoyllysine-residue acetyltransferase [Methylicorpusculum sp.]MDZ4149768.1 dihydrolipoyllysine-residue acetyltransferase [Methylicorpusculum sp.]